MRLNGIVQQVSGIHVSSQSRDNEQPGKILSVKPGHFCCLYLSAIIFIREEYNAWVAGTEAPASAITAEADVIAQQRAAAYLAKLQAPPTGEPLNPDLRGSRAWEPFADTSVLQAFEVDILYQPDGILLIVQTM